MDDKVWTQICNDLKQVQQEMNSGDWLMNQFLKNSYPDCSQEEACCRLLKAEQSK